MKPTDLLLTAAIPSGGQPGSGQGRDPPGREQRCRKVAWGLK